MTLTEVLSGIRNKKEAQLFDRLFAVMNKVPVSANVAHLASDYLRQYCRRHRLDPFDAIIGATAENQGLVLATLNLKHFPMMPGLARPYP